MPRPQGYHYAADGDGQFAVQVDEPYPGAVTLTWTPTEQFDPAGKSREFLMPQQLFESVVMSYAREAATLRKIKA